jgi:DNA invertase Pin-like site-specific DNA recombinase
VYLDFTFDRLRQSKLAQAYDILVPERERLIGAGALFVKAPQGASAEDQLLVQFQGMIAEYERAQILERSRRGKRHRARSGEVSVLSGAHDHPERRARVGQLSEVRLRILPHLDIHHGAQAP